MSRRWRVCRPLTLAAMIGIVLVRAADAQSASTSASAQIDPLGGSFSPCLNSQPLLGAGAVTPNCTVSVPGASATAAASATRVPGGIISSSIAVNGGADAHANAAIFDYVYFTGPTERIFRAAIQTLATVNASPGLFPGAASVELFIAFIVPGGTARGASDVLTNLPFSPAASRTLSADIAGSALRAGGNAFFFGLFTDTQNGGNPGEVFASASATVPTFSIWNDDGREITKEFSMRFASAKVGDVHHVDDVESDPVSATPEPVSMALVATGMAGLAAFRRRGKRRAS